MHDLLRLYADEKGRQARFREERRAGLDRLLDFYRRDAAAAHACLRPADRPNRERTRFVLTSDALMWMRSEEENIIGAAFLALHSRRDAIAFDIVLFLHEHSAQWSDRHRWAGLTRRALDAATVTATPRQRLLLRLAHGSALDLAGSPKAALGVLEPALQSARTFGDRLLHAFSLMAMGSVCRSAGQSEEAEKHAKAAAELLGSAEPHLRAHALNNAANAIRQAGKADQAVATHREVLSTWRAGDDMWGEAESSLNLGNALVSRGDLAEALGMFRCSVRLYGELGDPHGMTVASTSLATQLAAAGREAEAADSWLGLADFMRDRRRTAEEVKALTHAARALEAAGDLQGSLRVQVRISTTLQSRSAATGAGAAASTMPGGEDR
ncbi:tetratricopeptide repeat protein [Streptomyces sp. NPDC093111]|uniref:tetratricopeptide repeat protein n=1 Tax=Streptomyces sp. NPDC093111 TaxID=3154978 RepID=UPI00343B2497